MHQEEGDQGRGRDDDEQTHLTFNSAEGRMGA